MTNAPTPSNTPDSFAEEEKKDKRSHLEQLIKLLSQSADSNTSPMDAMQGEKGYNQVAALHQGEPEQALELATENPEMVAALL